MRIGLRGIVLDDVPCQRDEIRRKAALAGVGEYLLQRVVSDGAAKRTVPVGEKMRVRQMQDPHRVS